jgi:hypothetical protein
MPRFNGIPVGPRFNGEPVKENKQDLDAGARALSVIRDLPRAGGVAARNLIEGVGATVDFLGTPIRVGMQYAGMPDPSGGGNMLADYLGLPKAANKTERIVSEAEKFLASGGGILGMAGKGQKLAKATSATGRVLKSMTARPDLQAASMVGAGLSGGSVKEAGGGKWEQLLASVVGGLAAPASVGGARMLKQYMDAIIRPSNVKVKIDAVIDAAARTKGLNVEDVASSVRAQLAKDIEQAMKHGDVSPGVIRRLVDYRLTGATPTAGPLSMDPGVITRQKNLASLGANTQDPKLQTLSRIEYENMKKLVGNLDDLGANTADDAFSVGEKVIGSLDDVAAQAKAKIDPLYQQARNAAGRSAELDPSTFTNRASDLLDEALLGSKLPSDVRGLINRVAEGKMPLTVDVAEQLKTRMGQLGRSTSDKQERLALKLVRQALEETPLLNSQGKTAIDAFNAARSANRAWMQIVDRTPALKAVVDGIEPDKFVQTFILGTGKNASVKSVANLKNVIKGKPEAVNVIKDYMAKYLKGKATGGSERFSSSAYNRALEAIGDRKLGMFFSPEEMTMLKAIGRVARYEQAQPTGSAVNNSRTAGALLGALDSIGANSLLRRIPLGSELIANPARSISANVQAERLMRVPTSAQKSGMRPVAPILAPLIADQGNN